jgi:hypothetical protein
MTPAEAARWMKEQLDSEEMLYQSEVAYTLGEHEDERLAYYDDDGNLCVGKQVLAEFRKITPDVVYVRSEKMWRRREDYDEPWRLQ